MWQRGRSPAAVKEQRVGTSDPTPFQGKLWAPMATAPGMAMGQQRRPDRRGGPHLQHNDEHLYSCVQQCPRGSADSMLQMLTGPVSDYVHDCTAKVVESRVWAVV
uniref:Uncharacterized protein n=1 Tax=Eutreptiella gymnastica TaxID=73025 RepID=A0A7S4CB52_9EUGL